MTIIATATNDRGERVEAVQVGTQFVTAHGHAPKFEIRRDGEAEKTGVTTFAMHAAFFKACAPQEEKTDE